MSWGLTFHLRVVVSWVAASVISLFLITGCAANDDPVSDSNGWNTNTQPGRMGKLRECLKAAGWDPVFDSGVLMGPSLPKEQAPLYEADQARCAEETHFFDPMTAEDYRRIYPLEVASHQCLLDHGYESTDPPSEQQFIDDWLAGSPDSEPYEAIGRVFHAGDINDFRAATQACPPPSWGF